MTCDEVYDLLERAPGRFPGLDRHALLCLGGDERSFPPSGTQAFSIATPNASRFGRAPVPISVLIFSCGSPEETADAVKRISEQDIPPGDLEVLAISAPAGQGSSDGRARNCAARNALGDVLFFCDPTSAFRATSCRRRSVCTELMTSSNLNASKTAANAAKRVRCGLRMYRPGA